jgi:hypothetical protein
MAIKFADFVPRQVKAPGFLTAGDYETFDAAATAASDWITKHSVRVVAMETVVLPSVWAPGEQGTRDGALPSYQVTQWHQFLRVWYQA